CITKPKEYCQRNTNEHKRRWIERNLVIKNASVILVDQNGKYQQDDQARQYRRQYRAMPNKQHAKPLFARSNNHINTDLRETKSLEDHIPKRNKTACQPKAAARKKRQEVTQFCREKQNKKASDRQARCVLIRC